MALPWYLLSAGDNRITVDSIVVSGRYMNIMSGHMATQLAKYCMER